MVLALGSRRHHRGALFLSLPEIAFFFVLIPLYGIVTMSWYARNCARDPRSSLAAALAYPCLNH
jgi:hypothetical protein